MVAIAVAFTEKTWLSQELLLVKTTDENIIERLREERLEHLRTWPHLNNMEAYRGRSRIRCGNTAIV